MTYCSYVHFILFLRSRTVGEMSLNFSGGCGKDWLLSCNLLRAKICLLQTLTENLKIMRQRGSGWHSPLKSQNPNGFFLLMKVDSTLHRKKMGMLAVRNLSVKEEQYHK